MDTEIAEIKAELSRIRLEDDLTFAALATQIGLKGHSGLVKLLNGDRHRPHERTLYKIRRYLDARRSAVNATARPRPKRVS